MFPFHTWLPDAHTEAPTAGSVILAAVMLKLGAYGLIRFAVPLFPAAAQTFAPAIIVLSLIAIIYGAIVALVQPDLKRLVAYSSVSHMGFVTLGIFVFTEQGLQGAVLQMINHGLITGAFLLVGVIYERTHDRTIAKMGGLAAPVPVYAATFGFFVLASAGLPGLSGFVGEFLVLVGSYAYSPWVAAVTALGMILAAAYLLWMFQRVAFGEISDFLRSLGHHLTDMRPVIAPIVPWGRSSWSSAVPGLLPARPGHSRHRPPRRRDGHGDQPVLLAVAGATTDHGLGRPRHHRTARCDNPAGGRDRARRHGAPRPAHARAPRVVRGAGGRHGPDRHHGPDVGHRLRRRIRRRCPHDVP
jgi:hypothetical protein